jgi:hypothetical protein
MALTEAEKLAAKSFGMEPDEYEAYKSRDTAAEWEANRRSREQQA